LKTAFGYALEHWSDVDETANENAHKIRSLLPATLAKAKDCCIGTLRRIKELESYFIQKSVWSIGGDGWAYDIGFGGLDHVMASNRKLNIFVMDTEVYSNTGGQASKATPLGSVARFAESGKNTTKKDLGMMMMSYGYVYVASIAMGANKNQALNAILEAEAYPGPAIIIAYAPCINHGIDMGLSQKVQKTAVDCGYWLLYRYNPMLREQGKNPLILDSKEPTLKVTELIDHETRYTSLKQNFPERQAAFQEQIIHFVRQRYEHYRKLAQN
ncbi:MAG: pyruvate:ferredoxin (flavodoxin) oxidoreductase, partial [Candidatus Cloacimonetes bacterium]|nr:pyruvate:ferredoxin (flavodoxin) oxidoreductase [Candidatus Cloacimonadota bacterium]